MARRQLIVRSHIVPPFLAALSPADAEKLRVAHNLPPNAIRTIPLPVPLRVEQTLPEEAAELLGDPFLGLHLASRPATRHFGLVEFIARSAPTLGDALRRAMRLQAFFEQAAEVGMWNAEGKTWLSTRYAGEPLCSGHQGNEYIVATFVRLIGETLGVAWQPERVIFAHPAPRDLSEWKSFLPDTTFESGAGFNAMAFPQADLERAPVRSDPVLLEFLEAMASERLEGVSLKAPWLQSARRMLRDQLNRGGARVDALAGALRVSVRTLQRRLSDERLTFEELLASVRHERALELLGRGGLSLTEIALRLGFSEASAFSRAFTRWTGQSPSAYRKAKQGDSVAR